MSRPATTRAASRSGWSAAARIITSAAAIVILVSLAFASADMVIVKALGVGMALAVLLDATLVRGLLVPATMRLLGNVNWWWPAPLPTAASRQRVPCRARCGALPPPDMVEQRTSRTPRWAGMEVNDEAAGSTPRRGDTSPFRPRDRGLRRPRYHRLPVANCPPRGPCPRRRLFPRSEFPQDEAPHHDLTEWWYYTGHLYAGRHRASADVRLRVNVFQTLRGQFAPYYAAH